MRYRGLRDRLGAACLVTAISIASSVAQGEVHESVSYEEYSAIAIPNASLREILNSASRIRRDGRIYHAYTHWNVTWDYRWYEQPDGRCKITAASAKLVATITLPKLIGGEPVVERQFQTYVSSLRTHELGHLRIGQEAAKSIVRDIQMLPQTRSCATLEQQANNTARRTLKQHMEMERRYDDATEFGRSQGASLSQ